MGSLQAIKNGPSVVMQGTIEIKRIVALIPTVQQIFERETVFKRKQCQLVGRFFKLKLAFSSLPFSVNQPSG